MRYVYGVLGAGRQGTAAAFDLARFGEAKTIFLADRDLATARHDRAFLNLMRWFSAEMRIGSTSASASTVVLRAPQQGGPFYSPDC